MHQVSRTHPPDKTVLENISLSFFHGREDRRARAQRRPGKSTLLRIMAGVDDGYRGEAQLKPGATVGLLEQEPQLDESKDVRGNVEDGVRELRDLVDRYNEVAANYSDETADEFARLQDQIDAADAWNLDTMLDTAMDALRLPPGDADVTKLSGGERRRVALCRLLLRRPGPAAARRADQPPRRRVGRLARAAPRGVQGRRRRGHPRPLLPRQRRRLDPRARPRPRDPVPGQLLVLARAEDRSGSSRRSAPTRPAPGRSPPSSSGCARTRRAGARSRRPASPATRRCSPRSAT